MAMPTSQSEFKSGPVLLAQAPIVFWQAKYHTSGLENLPSAAEDWRSAPARGCTSRL
jgi:hypothetical protein